MALSDSGDESTAPGVEARNDDGDGDEAQIDSAPLVGQVEVQRNGAHDGKEGKNIRLTWKFFNAEDAVDNNESKGKKGPDSGEPRLRRLVPCERCDECRGNPGVSPCSKAGVGGVFHRAEAGDGVEGGGTTKERRRSAQSRAMRPG